jgi:hypothetical protein
LEELTEIEQLRSKAKEALEIDNDKQLVRCQGCGDWRPITEESGSNLPSRHSTRIYKLRMRIKYKKQAGLARSHSTDCREEEAELQRLLDDQKKHDFLKRLPLYSCSITGYRFLCSTCFDKLYLSSKNKG